MTGSASPLTGGASGGTINVEEGAKKWNDSGLPYEKLILGIPGYGRAWILSDVRTYLPRTPYVPLDSYFTMSLPSSVLIRFIGTKLMVANLPNQKRHLKYRYQRPHQRLRPNLPDRRLAFPQHPLPDRPLPLRRRQRGLRRREWLDTTLR